MKNILKKYKFIIAIIIVNSVITLVNPQVGSVSFEFTMTNLSNFVFILVPIFICVGLLDVWVKKETMIGLMGKKSGGRGIILSYLLGVVTAVPLYALFPIAGMMLKKQCSILNVLIFICSSASIRIPLLLFEASSLGIKFTTVRFITNIFVVIAIAFIIEKLLSDSEKQEIYNNIDKEMK